jgi:thiol-disulfide isomerase/thioredoxin
MRDPSREKISMRQSLSLILLIALLTLPGRAAFATGSPGARSLAPNFTLPTSSGTVSLHDLRGKVVFVDFWASWCMPCRQSFPWMSGMSDRYSADGLVIVSINLDKNREAADAFLQQFPAPFTVAFDSAGKTAVAFHVEAMPSSFIVSRTGNIVYSHAGFQPKEADRVETQIKEALSK